MECFSPTVLNSKHNSSANHCQEHDNQSINIGNIDRNCETCCICANEQEDSTNNERDEAILYGSCEHDLPCLIMQIVCRRSLARRVVCYFVLHSLTDSQLVILAAHLVYRAMPNQFRILFRPEVFF
jgi:hypothetical protein